MKRYDFEQYSNEWYAAHIGKPSSSCFDKILTPKTLKPSAQRIKYKHQLVAERLLNQPMQSDFESGWMERGLEEEPKAANAYSFENNVKLERVGLITSDDGRIVTSPDRLIVGHNAAVEIKSPSPVVMVGYLDEGFGDAYRLQVQGQLLVGEFDFVDKYAWNAYFPRVCLRSRREDEVISALSNALDQFCDEIDELTEKLRTTGFFQDEMEKTKAPPELAISKILSAG